jgi:hypothetical protein
MVITGVHIKLLLGTLTLTSVCFVFVLEDRKHNFKTLFKILFSIFGLLFNCYSLV